jgi:hypothetical protein
MSNGATFQISLYYRDAASNKLTVAALMITNSAALFPTNTHLTDFNVQVAPVKPDDAWAGKNIGIQLASALTLLDTHLAGGYWDVDNVRLKEVQEPILKDFTKTEGQFRFALQSAPGRYEVLASTNVALPVWSWSSLGTLTNVTGTVSVTDTNVGQRFYQIRTSP